MTSNYINGAWIPAQPGGLEWTSRSPADASDVLGEYAEDVAAVDAAVDAAARAQRAWDALGIEGRTRHLQALAEAFKAREDEMARLIAREVGKPLWEARGEARALAGKIAVTLEEGMKYTSDYVLTPGTSWWDGGFRYRPLGVCGVIGPFNFPVHLANGHIIPALALGNTVVLKPSELAPTCAALYMEMVHAAGLPPGVINMVQGQRAVGERLVAHNDVKAILFTGSVEVGLAIRRATVEQPWKLLALEMGGKNTSLVLDGADLDRAAYEIGQGALLTCGQRCTATSRVAVAESLLEGLIHRLERIWTDVRIGHPLDDATFMGPLVRARAKQRFLGAVDTALAEDLEAVIAQTDHEVTRDGRALDGHYVTPGLWLAPPEAVGGPRDTAELFGPEVILHPVDDGDDDRFVEVANATPFGLAMSIFASDRDRAVRLADRLEAGILNLNRSTVGASGKLPFGGVKMSGNHRPAAVLATQYCAHPVATLPNPVRLDTTQVMPRFPNFWDA